MTETAPSPTAVNQTIVAAADQVLAGHKGGTFLSSSSSLKTEAAVAPATIHKDDDDEESTTRANRCTPIEHAAATAAAHSSPRNDRGQVATCSTTKIEENEEVQCSTNSGRVSQSCSQVTFEDHQQQEEQCEHRDGHSKNEMNKIVSASSLTSSELSHSDNHRPWEVRTSSTGPPMHHVSFISSSTAASDPTTTCSTSMAAVSAAPVAAAASKSGSGPSPSVLPSNLGKRNLQVTNQEEAAEPPKKKQQPLAPPCARTSFQPVLQACPTTGVVPQEDKRGQMMHQGQTTSTRALVPLQPRLPDHEPASQKTTQHPGVAPLQLQPLLPKASQSGQRPAGRLHNRHRPNEEVPIAPAPPGHTKHLASQQQQQPHSSMAHSHHFQMQVQHYHQQQQQQPSSAQQLLPHQSDSKNRWQPKVLPPIYPKPTTIGMMPASQQVHHHPVKPVGVVHQHPLVHVHHGHHRPQPTLPPPPAAVHHTKDQQHTEHLERNASASSNQVVLDHTNHTKAVATTTSACAMESHPHHHQATTTTTKVSPAAAIVAPSSNHSVHHPAQMSHTFNDATTESLSGSSSASSSGAKPKLPTATKKSRVPAPASQGAPLTTSVKRPPIAIAYEGSSSSSSARSSPSLSSSLRNQKMQATDCLLFAASLLQDSPVPEEEGGAPPSSLAARMGATYGGGSGSTQACAASSLSMQAGQGPLFREGAKLPLPAYASQQHSQTQNQPCDLDVLCGRGGLINKHSGKYNTTAQH